MGERWAALAFCVGSGAYLAASLAFPLGTAARPGPGFFPVAVGAFLCLVALGFALAAFARPVTAAGDARVARPADAWARVAVTMAALAGFCLLLPWTGYPPVAFVFVALLLKRLGDGGWVGALVAAALGAAASYYVFAVLLAVPLPKGVLFE
jgi:hypothetical protein